MYRLSKLADSDLANLYEYSIYQFGVIQADKYYDDLLHFFEQLSLFPKIGRKMDFIRPNLLCHTHKSHNIFYKIQNDEVFILRILHCSRNYQLHF